MITLVVSAIVFIIFYKISLIIIMEKKNNKHKKNIKMKKEKWGWSFNKSVKDARGASFFIGRMRQGGAETNFANPYKRGGRQVVR